LKRTHTKKVGHLTCTFIGHLVIEIDIHGMLVLLLHYDKRGDQSIDANMINAAAIFVKSTWYSMKRLA